MKKFLSVVLCLIIAFSTMTVAFATTPEVYSSSDIILFDETTPSDDSANSNPGFFARFIHWFMCLFGSHEWQAATYESAQKCKWCGRTTGEPLVDPVKYKASCKEYAYEEISRNPGSYKGKKIKFTGEVIQVVENYTSTTSLYRVATSEIWGSYIDDVILVELPTKYADKNNRILEDDIVTVYGTFNGVTSYESIFGQTITIPYATARFIDIEK